MITGPFIPSRNTLKIGIEEDCGKREWEAGRGGNVRESKEIQGGRRVGNGGGG